MTGEPAIPPRVNYLPNFKNIDIFLVESIYLLTCSGVILPLCALVLHYGGVVVICDL